LGVVFVAALVAFVYFRPRAIATPPPLPNPNGYDDLLRAGELVVGVPQDPEKAGAEELGQFVRENSQALKLARVGLSRECGVPLEYARAQIAAGMPRLDSLRKLARLFAAEGKVAENEMRTAEAAQSYLDLLRLGQEIGRGGVLIDRTMGQAYETLGIERLQSLQEKLDAAACRELAQKLEDIEARREPFADALAREHELQEALIAEMGFAGRINRSKLLQLARQAEAPVEQRSSFVEAKLRGLIRTLVERADELKKPASP
jgi:hypothetical protein